MFFSFALKNILGLYVFLQAMLFFIVSFHSKFFLLVSVGRLLFHLLIIRRLVFFWNSVVVFNSCGILTLNFHHSNQQSDHTANVKLRFITFVRDVELFDIT